MTLQEEFEKANYKRPGEPFSENINPEQWCHVLKWCENYIDFLEKKVNELQCKNYQNDVLEKIRSIL